MTCKSCKQFNAKLSVHKQSSNLFLNALEVKSTPKFHLLFDDKIVASVHNSLKTGDFSTSECCFCFDIFSREAHDKILNSFHGGIRLNKFSNQNSC